MTIVQRGKEGAESIFDCITREAEKQRGRHPDHVDAIAAAEKKTRSLVKDGKLEENLMLVEFTKALERLWSRKVAPRARHNAIEYASE